MLTIVEISCARAAKAVKMATVAASQVIFPRERRLFRAGISITSSPRLGAACAYPEAERSQRTT